MRVHRLLGVVSFGALLAAGTAWSGCGGGASTGVDGGPDGTMGSAGSGGSAGAGGAAGSGGQAGSGGGAGSGGTTGSGGAGGSGGGGGSGGTAGSGEGGTKEGGSKEGGGSAPGCPTTPCPGGDSCCANVTAADAAAALTCESTCAGDDTLGCTAATDCAGGSPFCCVTAVFKGGGSAPDCFKTNIQSVSSTCSTEKACPSNIGFAMLCNETDTVHLCTTSKDCTEKGYTDCCQLPLGATTYSACVPPVVKTLDPSIVCD